VIERIIKECNEEISRGEVVGDKYKIIYDAILGWSLS
jgi:hypothetical protein